MVIPEGTHCLFHAQIEDQDGTYHIAVPEREVTVGGLNPGQAYRVAILPAASSAAERGPPASRNRDGQAPPVDEGDTVEVEIEDIGEQGDGLARIGPGYIVFVSETELGDRVTVEISQVKENFAFADVVEGPY